MRVLIVEDEAAIAAAYEAALVCAGHEVVHASCAEEALLHRGCDVLIADVGLPGLDGLELIEVLRRRGERLRAVVVSGEAELATCQRALRVGADEFLTKPLPLEELVDAVEQRREAYPREVVVLERTMPATEDVVECFAREVAAFAARSAVSPSARARIATACAELVENTVRHAFPAGVGDVRLRGTLDRHQFELAVEDDGAGFDPLSEGLDHMTECRAGGLARVAALAEDVRIESAPGAGTRIQARFDVARALFDEEEQVDLSELDWLPPQVTREVLGACEDDPDGASRFVLSPALAVSLGRLLAGPDPRRVLRTALWS